MATNFVNIDRDTPFLMPPDAREWIAEDDPVHFIIEAVMGLQIRQFRVNTRGSGSQQYPPKTMLALLIYCYTLGIVSSRKIERATYRDVAVRYLMAGHHPDHDTIATFRKVNRQAISEAFLQVLLLAREMGILRVGTVSVDGTRIKADASRHRNVRYDRACELIEKLKADIDELLRQAAEADSRPPDDDRLPAALARREKLLEKLKAAKQRMEDRAREQAIIKHAEQTAKQEAWEQREPRSGRKPLPPVPIADVVPQANCQSNLTDPDSRLMTKRGETGQVYNAQAVVDADGTMLILAATVVQGNDIGMLKPMIDAIDPRIGKPACVLADSGYAKAADIEALEASGIDPYVAIESTERRECEFRPEPSEKPRPRAASKHPTQVAMKVKLETDKAKRLYRLRQQTVEPVFGIVKEQLGFRQFGLRGLSGAGSEWTLVALAYNFKRLATLVRQNKAA